MRLGALLDCPAVVHLPRDVSPDGILLLFDRIPFVSGNGPPHLTGVEYFAPVTFCAKFMCRFDSKHHPLRWSPQCMGVNLPSSQDEILQMKS